jgi:hypothetical protein
MRFISSSAELIPSDSIPAPRHAVQVFQLTWLPKLAAMFRRGTTVTRKMVPKTMRTKELTVKLERLDTGAQAHHQSLLRID